MVCFARSVCFVCFSFFFPWSFSFFVGLCDFFGASTLSPLFPRRDCDCAMALVVEVIPRTGRGNVFLLSVKGVVRSGYRRCLDMAAGFGCLCWCHLHSVTTPGLIALIWWKFESRSSRYLHPTPTMCLPLPFNRLDLPTFAQVMMGRSGILSCVTTTTCE